MRLKTDSPISLGSPDTRSFALRIDSRAPGTAISPTLFGLFLEDINFAADGGLNANVVNNHSFEGAYLNRKYRTSLTQMVTKRKPKRLYDRTRHWHVSNGRLTAVSEPGAPSPYFGRLTSNGQASLDNHGYPGDRPGIAARAGTAMLFKARIRADQYSGRIEIQLVDDTHNVMATAGLTVGEPGWNHVSTTLKPSADGLHTLRIMAHGAGKLDVDEISLVPEDHWGSGDPRWSQGLLRRDLVESLIPLSPRFLRFPGGCIVEGLGDGNHYRWKNTIGPLNQRTPDYNLWAMQRPAGDYSQSYQVGFYEYFLLCEDLGMEPLPVVWAGLSCQFRSRECLPLEGQAFSDVVQDAIDLVDWATGDPATNQWAALRAQAGHPEPFPLNYIAIGNENYGAEYLARFDRIKEALDEHRPGLTYVISAGPFAKGKGFDQTWDHAGARPDHLIDEHFYKTPDWFLEASTRYDAYPRNGAKVFAGEYAAHTPTARTQANTWQSALAEAAFLTGIERNADVVRMTSYAPLFNLVEHGQWKHNLIDFNPTTAMPTANYVVQQLFGGNLGTTTVALDGTVPAGIFTSASRTENTAFIKLVNSQDSAMICHLDTDGTYATPTEPAQVTTSSAPLTAINRLTYSGRPESQIRTTVTTLAFEGSDLAVVLPPYSVTVVKMRLQQRN